MTPDTKGKRHIVGDYMPRDILADLIGTRSEPVAPEIAADRAAKRIIQAVRDRRNREPRVEADSR